MAWKLMLRLLVITNVNPQAPFFGDVRDVRDASASVYIYIYMVSVCDGGHGTSADSEYIYVKPVDA